MPLITARSKIGCRARVFDEHGDLMGNVTAANTDEGWLEIYPTAAGGKHVLIDRKAQDIPKIKIHMNYTIKDRLTDEVLFTVKWDMQGRKIQ